MENQKYEQKIKELEAEKIRLLKLNIEMEEELRKREIEEERKYNKEQKERYEVLKKAVEKMREEGYETKFFQTQTDDRCKIM